MFLYWCERLTFISLCLLIFVLPASIGGVSIFSCLAILFFLLYKTAESRLAVIRGQAWWSTWKTEPSSVRLTLPLVCFVAINFLATLWSDYPPQSRKAFVGKVLGHVFVYLAVRSAVNTPRRLRILLNILCVSAVLISLDALFQLWSGHDLFKRASLVEGRVSAAFNHPNGLGAYLVLALPLLYGSVILYCRYWRTRAHSLLAAVMLGAGFCLSLTVMGLTYSRGAWLGLVVAAVSFMIFARNRLAVVFLVVAVLAFMVYVQILGAYRHVSLVSENTPAATGTIVPWQNGDSGKEPGVALPALPQGEAQTLYSQDSIDKIYVRLVHMGLGGSDRLIYWRDAIKIVRDHPWTGTGLNTYANTIKKYNVDRGLYPHNGYLQMAAELGIFGLAIFLWFLFAHMVYGVGAGRGMDPDTNLLWNTILAGFAGFLAHGFLDTTFYSVQHGALLWFFFGLLAAGHSLAKGSQKEPVCQ
ncbi:MAG: hypothetical protein HGA80_02505 [Candidatus Omnitrophica bacterium]|nr:hypothetical protein [Candidatus Omnitrophota bacterium]